MRRFFVFFLCISLAYGLSSRTVAAQEDSDIFEAEFVSTSAPVHFSGDRFVYDWNSGVITGVGNIKIVQNESQLLGEKVVIDLRKNVAEIEQDVVIKHLGDVIEGEKGVYDFGRQEGVFYEALGHSEPWYFSAERIGRAEEHYVVERASLTTCNLPRPHYGLRSHTTEVFPGERLVARNLVLYAGRFPIFYVPYYSHGLGPSRPPLEFSAGVQSDVGGYARLGYNLELSEEVLLNPHIWVFTRSGVGGGLDGRLNLFEGEGRGRFETFYISDLNDDNTEEIGIEQDRGKADFYYRQEFPHDVTALLQLEYASDYEFLKTYDFDDYSERELPETFFNLERTGEHTVASFTVRERLVDYIEDVDKLPELGLDALEQRVGDSGFFLSATNTAAYLDIESDGPQSARNFTAAQLSYPLRLWKQVAFVPFLGGDATYYSKTLSEEDEYRLSWETGIVAQSRFHRVFGSPFQRYEAVRHLIVPTVTYSFRPTPDKEPEELPQFDSIDLIDRKNMLQVELRNYLQAKERGGQHLDLLEYALTAGLEFDDGEDTLATLENEVLIKPVPNWELSCTAYNDFREERRSDMLSASVKYNLPGSFKASVGVIHEDTVVKPYETQAVYSLSKAFGPLWRVGFEQRYSLDSDDFTYQEFWVWRDLHCWEILLSVRDRQEATSIMVLLNIKAFPMRRIEKKKAI